ncbi:MAG: OmpA family protein, partial [candidate division KSB1 bacterium]|nr:OmpA family protein [candidate division KSB1 bacterium]
IDNKSRCYLPDSILTVAGVAAKIPASMKEDWIFNHEPFIHSYRRRWAMRLLIFQVALLWLLVIARAQEISSNVANFDDPRVIFNSPAAVAFQAQVQMIAGYELYYAGLGADGLQNGFAGVALPHHSLGTVGLAGQYFSSGLYRRSQIQLGYGYRLISGRLSLGTNVGLISIAYDEGKFHLLDANDPVFQNGTSKNSLDVGAGVLAQLTDGLYWGFNLQHLNRPNISLVADDVRMPITCQTSFMLVSRWLNPLFHLEYAADDLNFQVGLEKWLFDHQFLLRGHYDGFNVGANLGWNLPLASHWLRLEYEYRYPVSELNSVVSASHQFLAAYRFSGSRQKPDFQVAVHPPVQTIHPGELTTFTITITPIADFAETVSLSLAHSSPFALASFHDSRVSPPAATVMVLKTDSTCAPNRYHFQVLARSSSQEKLVPVVLNVIPRPRLFAEIRASVDTLWVKETTRIRSRDPLLPYIFFGENQFSLNPQRYRILNPEQQPLAHFSFSPEKLLDISSKYQNTLNVIAKRLWDHPEMTITITGYNSGWGLERDNLLLSQRRAEAVRDYLVKNCSVRAKQIQVTAGQLPPDPASNYDPRGREENQRAEITCPLASQIILDPIVTETSDIVTSDSVCRFHFIGAVAEAGLQNAQVTIFSASHDTFHIIHLQPTLPLAEVVWDWKNDAGQSVEIGRTYWYQLLLQDKLGQIFRTAVQKIHVQKIRSVEQEYIQKNVEKTRLILFKYDRADLDLTLKSLQEELDLNVQKLKERPGARLLIQGFTDIIGIPEYNLRLSQRRANSAASYFLDRGIAPFRITAEGYGMARGLMRNDLPEGRMMNRRVEIYILY